MAEIPRAYIDNLTSAVNGISESMQASLAEALSAIDYSQDVATIRNQVIEIMQVYCGGATDQAAMLAAEFYDGLREIELGERMGAVANSGRIPEATDGAVRAFAEKLVEDKTEEFVTLCLERLDYEMKLAAGKTIVNNGRRDKRKPRYARVPSGIETCDFCLMLASRGFVYRDEAVASHAHSGCDCRVVPSWKSFAVQGYDTQEIYDRWQDSIDQMAKERAELHGTTEAEERRAIIANYERAASNAKKRNKR